MCPAAAGGGALGKNHAFCPKQRWAGQEPGSSASYKMGRVTLLADLVSTSSRVGGTSSRLAKVREIARLLTELSREEIEIGVSYLAGELPQGRIGIGYAALRSAAAAAG